MKKDLFTSCNFLLYAAKHYRNPSCKCMQEFREDLKRIRYVKNLIRRHVEENEPMKTNLILNHIVVFYNVFETRAATRMLFGKIDEKFHAQLKPFIVFLNYLPENDPDFQDIYDTFMDQNVIEELRRIGC